MVIGTHPKLVETFPALAEERRRIWKDWTNGGENSELYDTGHLPWILMNYRQVWDITLPPGHDDTKITAGMKRAGKREIINLLVDMFVLPQSCLDELDRHSDRLSGSLSPQQRARVVSFGDDSDDNMVVNNGDKPQGDSFGTTTLPLQGCCQGDGFCSEKRQVRQQRQPWQVPEED